MADSSDLVNCHFSVNQQALMSVIKPMMSELAQEWGYESRLSTLEKTQVMLQKEVALKAEAAGIQSMRKEMQEQRQQLMQKASQSALATMQAQLRSLESTISWKADQSALEEHVRSVEIACKQGETKADQSSLNRVLASTSKLQGQVSQMEKAVQESQGRLQRLEMHNLPGHAQRMSEHLSKSRSQFQKLHDILSSKVDVRDLEALANATKELQTAVALKVGPQPLQEIRSILRDMQLKLDLKVDVPVAEDLQAALNRVQSQLTQKAPAQEFREAASSIHSLRANLDGKVDFALLSELRVKVQVLEQSLEKKTETKDIPDLSGLKEAMNQKAERRQVTELSGMVERLQQELHFSLENDRAAFRRDLEARVEKMDQLERDLQNAMVCVESLTSKVDATPRLADASSPKGTASPTSERGSSPASPRPSGELREVMKALDGKADRSEIQELSATLAEQQQAAEAAVRQVSDLELQLRSARAARVRRAVAAPGGRSSQLAKQRWSGGSDPDPVFEAIREHYAVKDLQSRRRSIYYGKCRESLLRRVPQAVPELLPMHDMSSFLKLSMENTLEFIMGFRQMHKAAGLELYQDKIQLAKDFEARGYHVPKIFYASYAEDFDVLPTLQALEAQGRAYVAKASHLCCSQGVFVMDSGVERLTNQSLRPEDIQQQLQHAYAHPLSEDQVDPKCGDWGTVEAGKKPGVLVEELYRPSLPASFLDVLGADWVSPDVLACHLVWSTLYLCRWEINVRRSGERHTELLGTVFRDGSCLSCRYPLLELVNWPSTVQMLEALLPHTDYVRISIFLHETREPVINEVEYTTGGLEVFPVPIAREWTLRWLEGYYAFLS
ncbi:Fucoxanthin-chlorophyll a-c binding protein F [Durusdinium trenchii]|uniref:Chloroplastic n=1 Tax=Durusdinium trenchii TaxID=1381693 RepID=A0ABP0Q9Q9_9DINO